MLNGIYQVSYLCSYPGMCKAHFDTSFKIGKQLLNIGSDSFSSKTENK